MKINLCGPFQDPSGYGEFARFFAYALANSATDISCESISLPTSVGRPIDLGIKGSVVKSKFTINPKPHDVNIIFMIPPLFKAYKRKQAKYNIGFTMFEADKLPGGWADMCNEMDAILVPSEWNKAGFIASGVKKPIFVIPAGVVRAEIDSHTSIVKDDIFTFYSIFQWVERKNPINLLKAYFVAMQNKPDVRLVLKTYLDTRVDNNKERLSFEIERVKKELKLSSYPDIRLVTNFLTSAEIKKLHLSSHCFITPHRSEGWHMPAMEAMAYGNAVIATNYSGNTQFMTQDSAMMLSYFTTPCVSTDGFAPFFNGTMRWAEPNMEELIEKISKAYSSKEDCAKLGAVARKHIFDNFNENTASKALHGALQSIVNKR